MKKYIAKSIPRSIKTIHWLVLGNGFSGRRVSYKIGKNVQIIARPKQDYSNRFHSEIIPGLGRISMGAGWLHNVSLTNPQPYITPLLTRAIALQIPLIETDYSKRLMISETGQPMSDMDIDTLKSRIKDIVHTLHDLAEKTPDITFKEAFLHIPKAYKDDTFWTLIAASIEDWNAYSYKGLILKNELQDFTHLLAGILGKDVVNGYIPAHQDDEKDYLVLGRYSQLLDPVDQIPTLPFTIKGIYPREGWIDVVTEEDGKQKVFSAHRSISCLDAQSLQRIHYNEYYDFLAPGTREYLQSLRQGYYEKVFIKIADTQNIPLDKHFISIVSSKENRGLCAFMINMVALAKTPILIVFLSGPRAQIFQKSPKKTLKKIKRIIQTTFKTRSTILRTTQWHSSPFSGSYVHRESPIPKTGLKRYHNGVFAAGGWTNLQDVDTVTAALLSVENG